MSWWVVERVAAGAARDSAGVDVKVTASRPGGPDQRDLGVLHAPSTGEVVGVQKGECEEVDQQRRADGQQSWNAPASPLARLGREFERVPFRPIERLTVAAGEAQAS